MNRWSMHWVHTCASNQIRSTLYFVKEFPYTMLALIQLSSNLYEKLSDERVTMEKLMSEIIA